MEQLKNRHRLMQMLTLVLLFFSSMNFASKYFYFLFFAFGICLLLKFRHFYFDVNVLWLILLSIFYMFYVVDTGIITMVKQFAYPLCFAIGFNLFNCPSDPEGRALFEKRAGWTMTVIALGAFAHFLLNMLTNIGADDRNTIDIWSGEPMAATGQTALAIMAVAVFIAILFTKTKLIAKLLSLAGLLLVMGYNLVLAGRTLLVMIAILLVVAYLYAEKNKRLSSRLRVLLLIVICISILLFVYHYNIFGLQTVIRESNLFKRFENENVTESSRFDRKIKYIHLLSTYPFGGDKIRDEVGGYAHDLFLDSYNDIGVLGFLTVCMIVGMSLYRTFFVLKSRKSSKQFKIMILLLSLAMYLEFVIEPIFSGMPWFFCSFCILQGLLQRVKMEERR